MVVFYFYLDLVPSGVVLLQNRDLEQVLRVTVEEVLVELPEDALRHPAFLPLPPPLPAPWPRGLGLLLLLLLLLLWAFLDGGRWPLLLLLLLLFDLPDELNQVDVALGAGLSEHHAQKSGGKITVRQYVLKRNTICSCLWTSPGLRRLSSTPCWTRSCLNLLIFREKKNKLII